VSICGGEPTIYQELRSRRGDRKAQRPAYFHHGLLLGETVYIPPTSGS
jgi:hypothetical protein